MRTQRFSFSLLCALTLAVTGCDRSAPEPTDPMGANGKEDAVHLTGVEFTNRVLNAKGVALIDFWATWCGPCKMIAPTVESLAETHAGKILVGKVDVDKEQDLAVKYQIEGIPTLLLFADGKLADKIEGLASLSEIEALIQKHTR
jgi:thioredoxin 1